jgi:hypothetical protein
MSSSKVKRELRSRGTRQLDTYRNVMAIGAVIFVIVVIGGGVYDIKNNPPAFVQTSSSGASSAIYPYLGDQTINESIVSMFLYIFAFLGLYLVYKSTQVLYDRSKANTMMLAGIGLALVGVAGAYVIFAIKGGI